MRKNNEEKDTKWKLQAFDKQEEQNEQMKKRETEKKQKTKRITFL